VFARSGTPIPQLDRRNTERRQTKGVCSDIALLTTASQARQRSTVRSETSFQCRFLNAVSGSKDLSSSKAV
jgi:hypothetical protein